VTAPGSPCEPEEGRLDLRALGEVRREQARQLRLARGDHAGGRREGIEQRDRGGVARVPLEQLLDRTPEGVGHDRGTRDRGGGHPLLAVLLPAHQDLGERRRGRSRRVPRDLPEDPLHRASPARALSGAWRRRGSSHARTFVDKPAPEHLQAVNQSRGGVRMAIERMAVVGAGQMGSGIAQVAAQAGITVVLVDATPDLARRSWEKLGGTLAKLVEKGKLAAAEREQVLGRIRPASRLEDCAGADLAIEAILEDEAVKKELFRKLDAILEPKAILASNTSSISITALAAATRRPEQFLGMHFMNPPPVMQLIELIRGLQTSDATYEAVVALAKRFGKTVVTSKDSPGFIVNRILIPLLNEACFALQEGLASAEDIDTAVKLGLNHPMGPLTLADFVGLDTCLSIAEVLHRELGEDKYRPAPLLRSYVAAGWNGRKSGRGFYRYD
jgi:3-hydroxybutyryl-CoA dehydrogenase